MATAALGCFLHFVIATGAAAVYVFGIRLRPALGRRPVVSGLVYGVVVYLVMNFVVVPLSAAGRPLAWPPVPVLINGLLGHALLIGLPAALWASRAVHPARAAVRSARE